MSQVKGERRENKCNDIEVELEGTKALDFKRNNLLFTFKVHNPPKNIHSKSKSSASIKHDVIQSARIRKVVKEVSEMLT